MLVFVVCATGAAVAQAPLGDPDLVGGSARVDTDYTPNAKPTELWKLVAGTKFGRAAVIQDSTTSFDADLYAVSFRNSTRGLAVGAICKDAVAAPELTATCPRVPVIYRYLRKPNGERGWTEVYRGETPGYVGAVTWITATTAVAVGGDGIYPRREPPESPDSPGYKDPAGKGRAWLYENGAWTELDLTAQRALGMGGMTALDFLAGSQPTLGFAGALGQLWEWRGDGFVRKWDASMPDSVFYNHRLFRYRVRQIRFRPAPVSAGEPLAEAVTAGCCTPDVAQDTPRVLRYGPRNPDGSTTVTPTTPLRWSVQRLESDPTDSADAERRRQQVNATGTSQTARPCGPGNVAVLLLTPDALATRTPECLDLARADASLASGAGWGAGGRQCANETWMGTAQNGQKAAPGACVAMPSTQGSTSTGSAPSTVDAGGESCVGDVRIGQTTKDPGASVTGGAVCAAPLPPQHVERDTGVSGPLTVGDSVQAPVAGRVPIDEPLVPARNVNEQRLRPNSIYAFTTSGNGIQRALFSAGGQETADEPATVHSGTGGETVSPVSSARLVSMDGTWSMGELRSSRIAGLGAQGLAHDPAKPSASPDTVGPPALPSLETGIPNYTTYEPTSADRITKFARSGYYLLPSYSVNGMDLVDGTSVAWAVGDHGAILTLDEREVVKSQPEPDPPAFIGTKSATLPDHSQYDDFRSPPHAAPGTVPAAWEADRERRPSPAITQVGPGGPVGGIVMSRDGMEGWAFGAGAVFHYDGGRWNRCPADGKELEAPAPRLDGACRSIDGLPLAGAIGARVPTENDDDPSNDDDFEVVAVTGVRVLRYAAGRWANESDDAMAALKGRLPTNVLDVAFTAPDDGLILARAESFGATRLIRFDGRRWTDCTRSCDPTSRFPRQSLRGELTGLVAAGDRIYIYGRRIINPTRNDPLNADQQDQTAPKNLVWLGWQLGWGVSGLATTWATTENSYPLIAYKRRGETAISAEPRDGEYDPAFGKVDPGSVPSGSVGTVSALVVDHHADGAYEAWATGMFGKASNNIAVEIAGFSPPQTPLMHFSAEDGWRKWDDAGAIRDTAAGYIDRNAIAGGITGRSQIFVGGDPVDGMAPAVLGQANGRIFSFDPARRHWAPLALDRPISGPFAPGPHGTLGALAPNGSGGFWAVAGGYFFEYTDRPRKPLFEEVAQPSYEPGRNITRLAAAPDGTMWAATNGDVVYRYDRFIGWQRTRIPGWDPGRVVINPSPGNAVAVGPDGRGLVVGPAGRIGRLSATTVSLDPATGVVCDLRAPAPPCGTSRDLRAAAIAPDGSALVGGDRVSLLWRAPEGDFLAIERPAVSPGTRITSIAMPAADRAWLGTDLGLVYAGRMTSPGVWEWNEDNLDANGELVSIGAVTDLAVRPDGSGFATGTQGLLRRTERGDGGEAWSRVPGLAGVFTTVALPAGGGDAVLVGGTDGEILTLVDGRFEASRPAVYPSPAGAGRIASLALAPGSHDGQVEAWAAVGAGSGDLASQAVAQGLGFGTDAPRLLHYAGDAADPLLQTPATRVSPLPDAPAARPGETVFAAMGKSDCASRQGVRCYEMSGTTEYSEIITRRSVDEIALRASRPGGPRFAVWTGDMADDAGYPGNQTAKNIAGPVADWGPHTVYATNPYGPSKLARWRDFVADGLASRGLPLFGAVGGQDISDTTACTDFETCWTARDQARVGETTAWRQSMTDRPRPWGAGKAIAADGLAYRPVPGSAGTAVQNVDVPDPDGEGIGKRIVVPTGGASTHYAVDVLDERRDPPEVARLVVVDNSLMSLSSSDPFQQPVQPDGGQARWLQSMLCREGQTVAGVRCTRKAGQQAIVVANTPTYSYGPGAVDRTATDGASFEQLLMDGAANVVVTGRIGWNALYWTTAPGLHQPCPGGRYPTQPPDGPGAACGTEAQSGQPDPAKKLAGALRTVGAPPPPTGSSPTGLVAGAGPLPFVVASGAGGKPASEGTATEGFWHGYSIVRLDASGDPRKTIVEQRPIYDWIGMDAVSHVVKPRQQMVLRGFARGPVGVANGGAGGIAVAPYHLDRIDGAAVTHRYELLEADPERPYLPRRDAGGEYVLLDSSVASVDSETGLVRAGKGDRGRRYAIALLSVGEHATMWPLVFEPARSFRVSVPRLTVPPEVPPVRVLGFAAQSLAPPPAPPPSTPPPTVGADLQMPPMPAVPHFPGGAPAPVAPAPPPAPPPPPPADHALPLQLNLTPAGVSVPPTTGVSAQPTPPVNPSPPSGARKEAKQHQASAAKSEEGSTGASEARQNGGDLANKPLPPPGVPMTRRDRLRADGASFTAVPRQAQASAWVTGLEWGGGAALMALVLAFGWTTVRPTPRSRSPVLPAPAWARRRR